MNYFKGIVVSLILFSGCREAHILSDIDGNVYPVIQIGNQVWMAENLRVTRYRNGDSIRYITGDMNWSTMKEGAYCSYGNNDAHTNVYGRLYNWYAVQDSRSIAPAGWHIPTAADMEILLHHLQGDTLAGGYMKSTGTFCWLYPNAGATNASGFSALPGGYRFGKDGSFHTLGSNGYWWSSAGSFELFSWSQRFFNAFADVRRDPQYFTYGLSVRCVKD